MIGRIEDFAPEDCEAGVGLAIEDGEGRYLFFLAGTRHQCPPGELFYAGIGGHRERNQQGLWESWPDCAHREALEEIGADVELLSAAESWHVSRDGLVQKVSVADRPTPLALYEMIHQPDAPRAGGLYRIVIYRARLIGVPERLQPDEVRGVIALTKTQVTQSVSRKPTLAELLAEGAKLVAGAEAVAMENRLYPIGTAMAMGLIMSQTNHSYSSKIASG